MSDADTKLVAAIAEWLAAHETPTDKLAPEEVAEMRMTLAHEGLRAIGAWMTKMVYQMQQAKKPENPQ